MLALVIGHTGMLGADVCAALAEMGWKWEGVSRPDFDLADPTSSAKLAAGQVGQGADWVFNCAGYTAVDQAEEERDACFAVNALGPAYLAQACSMAGKRLLHISTDFVFDGSKGSPYVEDDPTEPLGAYGESKREGEKGALPFGARIVRTSWLFGPSGKSFPRTILGAWQAGRPLRVVADQMGTPTYTPDLARGLVELAELGAEPGLYHLAGSETLSWRELAVRTIRAYRQTVSDRLPMPEVEAIRTEDWPTPARRPLNSALDSRRAMSLGVSPFRPLDVALADFARRLEEG
jgi:dTDP-4-dehydrorhamnose reductase